MRRREFIAVVGGAAAWPIAARAQQTAVPVVGFLGAASATAWSTWTAAFVKRLQELGWSEGRTVAIEYRWAEAHAERYAEFAAEFVRLKVDVIVTSAPAVPAVKQATSIIPVVFALAGDPLGTGLVASLARPGSNVTGLSLENPETAGKRVELLREIVPNLRSLAILANVGYPAAVTEMHEVQTVARTVGLDLETLEIRTAQEIAPAMAALDGRAQSLYVVTDPLVNANRIAINTSARDARLPVMAGFREFAAAGALTSYGANYPDLFRRAGDLVDKILHGTKPGDIPVEQPTKFELVINLTTAKALGLTIPGTVIARADEVIE
jgi:putative tryptophan/tyrosine transport system substrate-binding protein